MTEEQVLHQISTIFNQTPFFLQKCFDIDLYLKYNTHPQVGHTKF